MNLDAYQKVQRHSSVPSKTSPIPGLIILLKPTRARTCLKHVNLHIVTLLVDIGKGSPTASIGNIVSPIDDSVSAKSKLDHILDITRELLEILTELAASSPRDSVDDCSFTSSSKSSVPGSSYYRQPSGLSAQENASSSFPTNSIDPSTSISVSHTSLHTSTKPDPALLLLILTTYISLSQLYTLLFSHVHSFLTELSESSNPYLCPLPGLIFRSFPLQSGNLQATIFIQIVTSLFERMENLLGLPGELCINPNPRVEGKNVGGLLSDEEFMNTVKMVFRTQSDQLGNRGGGVKVLRKYLREIKLLLRDKIAL